MGSACRRQTHRVNKHTRFHMTFTYRREQVTLMSGCRVIVELQWSSCLVLGTVPLEQRPKPGAGEQFLHIGSEHGLDDFPFACLCRLLVSLRSGFHSSLPCWGPWSWRHRRTRHTPPRKLRDSRPEKVPSNIYGSFFHRSSPWIIETVRSNHYGEIVEAAGQRLELGRELRTVVKEHFAHSQPGNPRVPYYLP